MSVIIYVAVIRDRGGKGRDYPTLGYELYNIDTGKLLYKTLDEIKNLIRCDNVSILNLRLTKGDQVYGIVDNGDIYNMLMKTFRSLTSKDIELHKRSDNHPFTWNAAMGNVYVVATRKSTGEKWKIAIHYKYTSMKPCVQYNGLSLDGTYYIDPAKYGNIAYWRDIILGNVNKL